MKKLALVLSTVLLSSQVFAAATLRLPIFLEGNQAPIPIAEVNKELAAVGAAGIPIYLEISSSDNGYDKVKDFEAKVAKVLTALGDKYQNVMISGGLVPGAVDTAKYSTCYTGDAKDVADIISGLTDIYYSDQLSMWGYKYKNNTVYMNSDDDETKDFLNEGSKRWKNWKGQGEDLLILSATGDGGDDVQESLITKCK